MRLFDLKRKMMENNLIEIFCLINLLLLIIIIFKLKISQLIESINNSKFTN